MSQAKTVNIYLLRHGKTVGEPALYGHTDIAVADDRQQQICDQLINASIEFSVLHTSPLKRCRELAQLIHAHNADLELVEQAGWKEADFGDLDGVPFEQAKAFWPQLEAFWQDPDQNTLPNAETLAAFYARVSDTWDEFTDQVDKDTLIVCHGGTIRMILARVLNLDWRNAALYSTLGIDHQSLTHIQITKADHNYYRVCSIGQTLIG